MATKKKPVTAEEKAVKETVEESAKVAEIEEKTASNPIDDFINRKLKAINNLNNPAKARRYAKWLFANHKRGIK